jgi:ABC-type sugar transport system ATPase subunit
MNTELPIDVTTPIKALSLAQKQLIVIARALASQAKFLLLDEPTSTLSHKEVRALFEVIHSLCKKGVGIFYISHRMPEVFEIANTITVFRDGRKVDTVKTSEVNLDDITFLMLGRKMKPVDGAVNLSAPKGEKILEVKNLSRKNKVDSVTFDLYKGEILCITGLAGAGKSELVRLLFGVEPRDTGEIWLENKKIEIRSPSDAVEKGIFLIPEERRKEGLLVKQNLGFNLSLCTIGKFCGLLGLVRPKVEVMHSNGMIQKLNIISAGLSASITNLSGGNQQKVNIGKWILRSSLYQGKVFIFDEPTKGVDVGAKEEIYRIVRELARAGYGVLFISPEIPEVLNIADRILVMANRRIVAQMDKHLTTEEMILKYAIGGIAPEDGKEIRNLKGEKQ